LQPGIGEPRGVAVTSRSQQDDWIGLDPPRNEREHLRGRTVEPLRVLDDKQQRSVGSHLREEVKRGHRDAVVLGGDFTRQAEGSVQRSPLNRG
jgi:hypothetical protein